MIPDDEVDYEYPELTDTDLRVFAMDFATKSTNVNARADELVANAQKIYEFLTAEDADKNQFC